MITYRNEIKGCVAISGPSFWSASNGLGGAPTASNDRINPSQRIETVNTRCYNANGPTSGTCGAGVALPTSNAANSFPFTMLGTGYTSTASRLSGYTAKTYTSVNPTADFQ